MSDSSQSTAEAAKVLDETVMQEFGQGNRYTATYSLKSDSDPTNVTVTLPQLVTFLRGLLGNSSRPAVPDLLGFGTNTVQVKFKYG